MHMNENDKTPTPLTDAAVQEERYERCPPDEYVPADLARQLERRCAELERERDYWQNEADAAINASMKQSREIRKLKSCLSEWKKWVDMGIEDVLPDWVRPVLNETYKQTEKLLKNPREIAEEAYNAAIRDSRTGNASDE